MYFFRVERADGNSKRRLRKVVAVKFCLRHYHLSATKWSARANACKALSENYSNFRKTLEQIATDTCDAGGLLKKFNSLDIRFMTVFWDEIMKRYITIQ
jgi:hypothetical protein